MTDEDTEAELKVLQYRYEELKNRSNSQIASREKGGEHNRRMLRLVFVFAGLLITGLSAFGASEYRGAIFENPHCAVFRTSSCIQTHHTLFIAATLLILAVLFYLQGSFGGLLHSFRGHEGVTVHEEKPIHERESSEREFLKRRISELETAVEENAEFHRSRKLSSRVGASALLFSIISFTILAIAVLKESGVGQVTIYSSSGLITIVIVISEWDIMKRFPLFRPINRLISRFRG